MANPHPKTDHLRATAWQPGQTGNPAGRPPAMPDPPREPVRLRSVPPDRTIAEAKDSAFKLINHLLWTLEGTAETDGVDAELEIRALRLLSGLNAALPKQQEQPKPKKVRDMTDEELEAAVRK